MRAFDNKESMPIRRFLAFRIPPSAIRRFGMKSLAITTLSKLIMVRIRIDGSESRREEAPTRPSQRPDNCLM